MEAVCKIFQRPAVRVLLTIYAMINNVEYFENNVDKTLGLGIIYYETPEGEEDFVAFTRYILKVFNPKNKERFIE